MSAEHIKITQFKPGASGNPKGRPKGSVSVSFQLKKFLAIKVQAADFFGNQVWMTIGTVIAMALIKSALKGNVRAFKEIADRTEGTVTQKMEHLDLNDESLRPVQIICRGVRPAWNQEAEQNG